MDINNFDIYWHLGKEIVLLKGYDYAVLEGVKSMMRVLYLSICSTTLGLFVNDYYPCHHTHYFQTKFSAFC